MGFARYSCDQNLPDSTGYPCLENVRKFEEFASVWFAAKPNETGLDSRRTDRALDAWRQRTCAADEQERYRQIGIRAPTSSPIQTVRRRSICLIFRAGKPDQSSRWKNLHLTGSAECRFQRRASLCSTIKWIRLQATS